MAKRNLPFGGATPMDAGERNLATTLEQLTEGTGGSSRVPTEDWTPLATPVWMRRLDLKHTERFKAEQLSSRAETQWEMGYRADMDPELVNVTKERRLVYQGRIYEITGASVIGHREGIELLTVVNGG